MRIAFLSPSIGWTQGVPHYVAALGNALAEQHEVHFFCGAVQTDGLKNVQVHHVPSFPWSVTGFHASFLASLSLRYTWQRLIRRQHFDIVHGMGYITPFANVLTAHFCQVREQRLLRDVEPQTKKRSWLRKAKQVDYHLYSRVSSLMERRYYRALPAKIVIAISENVKQDMIREFNVPPNRVTVIPNGVDVERFHPRNRLLYRQPIRSQLGLDELDRVALFVGNAWERKGLRSCIAAIRSYPDPRLKLIVVGEGDQDTFVTPQEARGPQRKVVFVNRREFGVEQYYAAADFLLFPTLYEPFGLVILEALASGLPVLTSASAGAAEYITHEETGLLLDDPSDVGELEGKLGLLLENPALFQRLKSQGRLLAEQFTWDRIAARTVEAYHMALSKPGPEGELRRDVAGRSRGGVPDAPRPAPQ